MKQVALAAALVAVVLALVSVTLIHRGRDAIAKSDVAFERSDFASAIVFAERAAQARLPFSPYPEEGYRRLLEIADKRATDNDDVTARAAYDALLRAARTTGDADNAHVGEARAGLAKIDARAKLAPATATSTDSIPPLGPGPRTRWALAAGVLLVAAGLASLSKASLRRYAWPALAVGLAVLFVAALQ